jgi:glycerol-1-phosphate dehydrogenase [NAD(P)+]
VKHLIEKALAYTTDTRECVIAAGAVDCAAKMFTDLFPGKRSAYLVFDPNTWKVAGERVAALLNSSGVECRFHELGADGRPFHAEYRWIDEVRAGYLAAFPDSSAPMVAVGSGTVNDIVKRTSEEVGVRYMVVGTAASMDGYTSFGAAITKDGMKQTLSCKAPLGCIVDSRIAAAAPREMTASGYADLIAKIPAGADWMLADAVGSEAIHPVAWELVQDSLRDALKNPEGCASGDIAEVEKLCAGLVMSGFAMQAMNSSRPASGTEHQISHYWDMEDLAFNGLPVSHGFKVGIGTLASTKTLEFLLRFDLAALDIEKTVAAWWPDFASLSATFPKVYGDRPAHIRRAELEMGKKYSTPERLREELSALKRVWPELSRKIKAQLMPFDEVYSKLKASGAPYEPEMIGISRARFRETLAGVPYMRSRYFALDLVERLGLMHELDNELFGVNGVWRV